jgi:Bacterial cadherin-like domain/Bacterial Ig domain
MKTQYNTLAHCLATAALLGAGLVASPAHALVVNLTAEAYNATMPNGDIVTMWGYRQDAGAVQSPGAQLIVPPGDTTLTINITNNLLVPTSIIVHSLNQAPQVAGGRVDPVYTDILQPNPNTTATTCAVGSSRFCRIRSLTHEAAANGGTASYTYNNVKPGTYMYQSGTLPQIQVQMGLYGMVSKNAVDPVVTPPSPGQAYPGLTVDNEIKLVFSEVDPLLHQSVAAGTFTGSTLEYAPKHLRVHSYDATGATATLVTAANQTVVIAGGSRQLIRMVNAGLQTRVPMISDGTWFAVAEDGNAYPYPREQYTAFLPAAKTMDVYYTPSAAGAGGVGSPARSVAVFDRRMAMEADSASTNGVRGQFVNLSVSNVAVVPTGPTVSVASCPATGTQDLAYSCTAVGNAAGYAFSLVAAPAGMAINATTGAISWTPTNAQAARPAAPSTVNPVTVRATVLSGTFAGQTADASLSVVVGNVNDAPVGATAQAYNVAGGVLTVPVATGVSVGVTDIDGDALAASVVTAPTNGTVTMNADGSFTYRATTLPATGTSTMSFTYKVSDVPLSPLNPGPALATVPATVTLTLNPNARPVAVQDNLTVTITTPRVATLINPAANDTDADGTVDATSVRLVSGAGVLAAANGLSAITSRLSVITVNATTGAVSYTPGILMPRNSAESFFYNVKDNFGTTSLTGTVRVTTAP